MLKRIMSVIMTVLFAANSLAFSAHADEGEYTYCSALAEISTGTLIDGANRDKPVPIGTLNKLMTVLITAEAIDRGELSLDTTVKTSAAANAMQGAQIWLMPGEEMTIEELLKGVIIGNANDASVALAEAVAGNEDKFVALMNSRAAELKMVNTSFTNCCGYYDDDKQVSTASELAMLAAELYKYNFLRRYFTCRLDSLRNGATELVSTNKLIDRFDGLVGFKASYTDNSGRCIIAAAERDGEVFAAVILGAKDEDAVAAEAKAMLNRGFGSYTITTPPLPKNLPSEIPLKKCFYNNIKLEYNDPKTIVVPKGTASDVVGKIFIPDYVFAPINKGDKIGEIHFYRGETFLFVSDIYAAEPAERLSFFSSFVIMLKFLLSF